MSGPSAAEQRFIALETLVTHQDKLITDLSDALYAQQRQLDRLEKRLEQAEKKLREVNVSDVIDREDESPPPHY